MSLWRLVGRSLGYYWRTNAGVLLAVLVSTAVLTGALVVGDSVRHSLMMTVEARLGAAEFALVPQNRFFRAKLADELEAELNAPVAPVLQLRAMIENADGTRRANRIELLGVDERFFKVGAGTNPFVSDWSEGIVINEALAARLRVGLGDEVKLRIDKPGMMPRDVPLMPDSDLSIAFRLIVRKIADDSQFGRFSLRANQVAPLNAFVPMQWLGGKLGRSEQANMLLVAASAEDNITVEKANQAVRKCWRLADAGLQLRELDGANALEIRSSRIFIDQSLAAAAAGAGDQAVGVLTYFVNELRLGDRTTPYSMVTAMEGSADTNSPIGGNMQDDEILINQWLADDLAAKVADSIELTYFVLGPMRKLQERKSIFKVREILPMDNPALDRELMPDFPGLADVNNCRDWKLGIPVDLNKIHDEDEDYWNRYRGTPKAFVTLKAGRAMWASRYGNTTAFRYPRASVTPQEVTSKLLGAVEPASVGLFFEAIRARGVKAGNDATDLRWIFLGLSIFLIVAAVVLTGLLFVFGVESRSEQVGMLLAVGFLPKLVRRLLFIEGGMLALLGAIAGTGAGLLYTKAMLYALSSAISSSAIHFYAKPITLLAGALVAVVVSLVAIWLTLRKQASRPARELLAGVLEWPPGPRGGQFFTAKSISPGRIGLLVAVVAAVGALVLLGVLGSGDSAAVSGAFFGAGALLLIAGLALTQALLKMVAGRWKMPLASLAGLGLRNSTRRSGRSLAVVALLACGIFLVIAVDVFRHDPLAHAERRDSGTGGFALYGESAIGILHNLNTDSGRKSMVLDDKVLEDVRFVQLRVHDGDDASCFNLNRAQRPRLLGVQPQQLQNRGAFTFIDTIDDAERENAWNLLNEYQGEDVVPAIGDYPTIVWALGKSLGDELDYTDEKGRKFRLRLVGMLKNSILQGSLLIAEEQFVGCFPSEDGYRALLIDAPAERVDAVTDELSARLTDFGLMLTSTRQRLAAFSEVENTYLSIFQILGGLGLVLGSVGLGLVVLRNMLDRRGEFAMLRAVGYNRAALKRLVFYEHSGLMLCGLVCGVVAALVAVGPALKSPGAPVSYFSLVLTIAAIGFSGLIWIRIATAFALSGKMLEALRNE